MAKKQAVGHDELSGREFYSPSKGSVLGISNTLIAMPRASRDPDMRILLETTKAELEERYVKVGALLDRRYFTQ